jgi:class 3 adenylate cyclase
MQQIAEWLERLGLSEYAQRFAENDIDFAILSDLTDQDLEKIGIASLGHRRKLLRAIATLKNIEKGTSAMAVGSSAAPLTLDSAERRQVTVMFSDLVDSTALSARMDPEDLRELISAYQKCVAETVHQFDGFVARYMGDGVLAYFGYPQAHEDDAERAVRAGLELSGALARLNTRTSLHTRIGIATGLVVVGDLIGSGDTQERSMVGTTPNIAARLQGTAESDMVVICDSTRRIVGNLFELEDLGPRYLKGIAGPVQAWAVLRPSSVASRFEALHATGMTALVGREEESELLLRCWSKATNGEGQVVLLSGEAGIGKSRLTAAIMELLADKPHTRLRISARRSIPTARSTRSSARWNVLLASPATTACKRSSTSSMRSSNSPPHPRRTLRSLPKCCRCRTMGAIPCSSLPRSSAGKECWTRSSGRWKPSPTLLQC